MQHCSGEGRLNSHLAEIARYHCSSLRRILSTIDAVTCERSDDDICPCNMVVFPKIQSSLCILGLAHNCKAKGSWTHACSALASRGGTDHDAFNRAEFRQVCLQCICRLKPKLIDFAQRQDTIVVQKRQFTQECCQRILGFTVF